MREVIRGLEGWVLGDILYPHTVSSIKAPGLIDTFGMEGINDRWLSDPVSTRVGQLFLSLGMCFILIPQRNLFMELVRYP